jgi:hypothetical protein
MENNLQLEAKEDDRGAENTFMEEGYFNIIPHTLLDSGRQSMHL